MTVCNIAVSGCIFEKHFVLKLTEADSEQFETQHWIEIASECQYINQNTYIELISKCKSIGKMLQRMINKSSMFCK